VFGIILAQLINLQLISGTYKQQAMNNALFAKVVYPDRGIIYDRKGKAILNNTIMFDLVVTPVQVKGIDTLALCELLGIDTVEFKKRMADAVFKNSKLRPSVFEDLLPPDLYAKLDENIWKFPGFDLVERPVRKYPFNVAAHILGYIGEADSGVIKRYNGFYRMGDYVGRSGLEQSYETVLRGQRGVKYIIRDHQNRLQGSYENGRYDTVAVAGQSLRTSLDIELQQLAEKLLTNKIGSIVALDPKTGGILAMASGPVFNPNDLTGANKQKNYTRLVLDVSGPLLNRAIKGQYPAGSTYKPLGALIGLDEGVITPASGYPCRGVYLGCNHPVKCTEKWAGHAANLRLAIAWSCNSFFSDVLKKTIDNPEYGSTRLGLAKWRSYCTAFGLGHRTGVDLPSEDGGNVPDTGVYNKEYRGSWNSCTMVGGGLGIGQEKMLVTPLQIATSISIVANKGYYYLPHFVQKIDGMAADDTTLNKYKHKHEVLSHIPDDVFNVVIDGMHDVTVVGTARGIPKIPDIDVCAKTGTAENKRVIDGRVVQLKDHSVFVCFAPKEDPKIVVSVIVENGGFGATWAGPMAYLMVEKYLKDTLRADRLKEVDRISAANLMPTYLPRLQFKEDSIRAAAWAKQTGDSSRLMKFFSREYRLQMMDTTGRYGGPKPKDGNKPPMNKPKNVIKPSRPDSVR
ncbi:MAG: penicillin-binding protein 2, partial [Bacteroidetes bacterium]|nr:penicillin-binding protein 2 [Bacteroidota bacterium]